MAHVARSAQSSSPPGGTEALSPATEGHASCPAPHPLPAAAGPTGHTGSPLNGSPSATAACRPERTGLAQGLLGRLPAPHFWLPLHLPQLCTRPAPARQSLLAHPPRVCSQTPTLLLTLVGGGIPSPPPPAAQPTHCPAANPAPPAGSALLPWGAGPVPSHSHTPSICVSPLQSGLLIKILQVSFSPGLREPVLKCCNLRPPGAARQQQSRVAQGHLQAVPSAAPTLPPPRAGLFLGGQCPSS